MYADRITPSMESAIDETNRRRAKQVAYNQANGIDPQPLRKKIADITDMLAREHESTQALLENWQHQDPKNRKTPIPGLSRIAAAESGQHAADLADLPSRELPQPIQELA